MHKLFTGSLLPVTMTFTHDLCTADVELVLKFDCVQEALSPTVDSNGQPKLKATAFEILATNFSLHMLQ